MIDQEKIDKAYIDSLKKVSCSILRQSGVINLPYILEFLLDIKHMGDIKVSQESKDGINVGTKRHVKLFYPWMYDALLQLIIQNGQHRLPLLMSSIGTCI